jgi:hypothetical protein
LRPLITQQGSRCNRFDLSQLLEFGQDIAMMLREVTRRRYSFAAPNVVAFGGIVLQNLNVFSEGFGREFLPWRFFRCRDEGTAAATRRHHLLTQQLRRTSRRRDWRRTAEELDETPQVLRGCGQ